MSARSYSQGSVDIPMTVVAMRISIERFDMPEPELPILSGLVPADAVAAAAIGEDDKVGYEDSEDEENGDAVMAGPQEYSEVRDAAAADAAIAVPLVKCVSVSVVGVDWMLSVDDVGSVLRRVVSAGLDVVKDEDDGPEVSLSGLSVSTAGSSFGLRVAIAMN